MIDVREVTRRRWNISMYSLMKTMESIRSRYHGKISEEDGPQTKSKTEYCGDFIKGYQQVFRSNNPEISIRLTAVLVCAVFLDDRPRRNIRSSQWKTPLRRSSSINARPQQRTANLRDDALLIKHHSRPSSSHTENFVQRDNLWSSGYICHRYHLGPIHQL
jgi:hypothetical protein